MNKAPAASYAAHLHWIVFSWPILLVIVGYILNQYHQYAGYVGLMLMAVGGALCVLNLLTYLTSFIAISNISVSFHSGVLVKNILEIPFNKIESVDIRQNILGSLLGYGAIIITGTGGTRSYLNYVADPLTCRRLIEQAMQG